LRRGVGAGRVHGDPTRRWRRGRRAEALSDTLEE
jgi:hypothetical protein